jgi:hypothetical protein
MITGLELLKRAAVKGWSFSISDGDGGFDYRGNDPIACWHMVRELSGEASVVFRDEHGLRLGAAYLMFPGSGTCEPDESLVDYSTTGAFGELCDAIIAAVL